MNERLWGILVDSFPKLLGYGIRVTVPLTIFSFAIALAVALIVALIQYANVKVLRQICRFYIWIVRGTPLLVQLYIPESASRRQKLSRIRHRPFRSNRQRSGSPDRRPWNPSRKP